MTDLAEAVMLSSGGLTRLVGRPERRELVQRTPDSVDARGLHAALTHAGSRLLADAHTTHDAVIEDLLGSKLSPRQTTALGEALDRAAHAMSKMEPGSAPCRMPRLSLTPATLVVQLLGPEHQRGEAHVQAIAQLE